MSAAYMRERHPRHNDRPVEMKRRILRVARMNRRGFTPGKIAYELGTTVPIVESYLDVSVREIRRMAESIGEKW
jgi:hypothetical protein